MNRRGFLVGLAALAVAATASADVTSPHAEVMVLHASQQAGAGSIDPRIGNLPQLKKPPFSSYNTYKLLDKKDLALEKGKASSLDLANGKKLGLTLLDATTDHRFKMAASIDDKTKIEVTASPDEPFFVAGQSHAGGILVVGITVRK